MNEYTPERVHAWARVFELAPDLPNLLDRQDWIEHLLTLLHPADRKVLLKKDKDTHERTLRRCAWIVAFHEYGHGPREADEQLYYLREDLTEEYDRLDALEVAEKSGREILTRIVKQRGLKAGTRRKERTANPGAPSLWCLV